MIIIGGHFKCIYNYQDLDIACKFIKNIDGNAIQFFLGDNVSTTNTSKPKFTPDEFKNLKQKSLKGLDSYIHSSLSLNFCNPIIPKYKWALDNLIFDMNTGSKLGVIGCVLHFGVVFPERYIQRENPVKIAYQNFVDSINYVLKNTPKNIKIILETSAGQKNKIGTTIDEIAIIYSMINDHNRVKLCIDTCHIFVAGYPINTKDGIKNYFSEFNQKIGLKNVILIHLNDSNAPFDSHRDLHATLLEGHIFTNKIILKDLLLEIKNKPMILETREISKYKKEIQLVKNLLK